MQPLASIVVNKLNINMCGGRCGEQTCRGEEDCGRWGEEAWLQEDRACQEEGHARKRKGMAPCPIGHNALPLMTLFSIVLTALPRKPRIKHRFSICMR